MDSETGIFALFSRLIGSAVRVQSRDLTFTTGVLYCIDPGSDDVVLLSAQEESDQRDNEGDEKKWSVKILLGHSVVAIHADDQASTDGETLGGIHRSVNVSRGARQHEREDKDSGALLLRRVQLCAFLRQRLIPCESDSATASIAVFGGAARVSTPFTSQSIIACANEQVLARLQSLLLQFEQE